MSTIVAVLFHVFLILLLSSVTVNGSLIRLFCQNPNSELCKMHQRRYKLNQHLDLSNQKLHSEPLFIRTFDEEIENLRDQLEGYRNTFPTNEELVKCINLGDDSCNNGWLPGSGKDDDFLNGNGNPGKRSPQNGIETYGCINLGDDSCNNGWLPGSGKDDDFLNGNGNPGKRSPPNDKENYHFQHGPTNL